MSRHRQVRLSYPAVLVELAGYLARRHGRYRAAGALGLPLSTMYRWGEALRGHGAAARTDACEAAHLDALLAACEAHGFDLRARVHVLEPLAPLRRAGDGTAAPTAFDLPRRPDAGPPIGTGAADDAYRLAPRTAGVHARVQRARDEIDRRYYAPLSCEQLAVLAGMSRFHFIRTFRNAYAVSPYRYLMQVRVRHALDLLGTTQQPLDSVAAAVGFDSQSSLCKAFKRLEGVSLSARFRGMRLGSRPGRAPAAQPGTAMAG
jgi:AraC-like DNA-binding protein